MCNTVYNQGNYSNRTIVNVHLCYCIGLHVYMYFVLCVIIAVYFFKLFLLNDLLVFNYFAIRVKFAFPPRLSAFSIASMMSSFVASVMSSLFVMLIQR